MTIQLSKEQRKLIMDRDAIIIDRLNILNSGMTYFKEDNVTAYDMKKFQKLTHELVKINKKLGL